MWNKIIQKIIVFWVSMTPTTYILLYNIETVKTEKIRYHIRYLELLNFVYKYSSF